MRVDPEQLRRVAVLHQDDAIVVVSKPAGLDFHGGAGAKRRTLVELLEGASSGGRLFPVHRLDRGTSGAVIFAKSTEIARALSDAWDATEKRYECLVRGVIAPQTIATALVEKDGRKLACVTEIMAASAGRMDDAEVSALLVRIHTGRRHQIRRHLSGIGQPILMDDQYGDFALNKRFDRFVRDLGGPRPKYAMLHAARVSLPHPEDGRALTVAAPRPEAWATILEGLGLPVDGPGERT